MSKRFVVRTVTGFSGTGKRGASTPPGLSAVVLDSAICYRRVAEFKSEDRVALPRMNPMFASGVTTLGHEGAVREARKMARRLNADPRS